MAITKSWNKLKHDDDAFSYSLKYHSLKNISFINLFMYIIKQLSLLQTLFMHRIKPKYNSTIRWICYCSVFLNKRTVKPVYRDHLIDSEQMVFKYKATCLEIEHFWDSKKVALISRWASYRCVCLFRFDCIYFSKSSSTELQNFTRTTIHMLQSVHSSG